MKRRSFVRKGRVRLLMMLFAQVSLAITSAFAQSNQIAISSNAAAATNSSGTRAQQIRAACIQGRRCICGRVLDVTRAGLVIDSGYTSLMQPPLNHSWVVAGTVDASRPANLLEGKTPDSPCVGLVFLTDIPRRPPVHQYDYVVIHGFPAGNYDYKPLAGISKNIRRFSAGLETAIKLNLQANEH
jgi:hypothetical protein